MKFSHLTVTVTRPIRIIAQVITGATQFGERTWKDETTSDQVVHLTPDCPRLDLTNITGVLVQDSGLSGFTGVHSLGVYIAITEPEKDGEEKTFYDVITLKRERHMIG